MINLKQFRHDKCNIAYDALWPITERMGSIRLTLLFDLQF